MAVDAKQYAGTDKRFFTVHKTGGMNTEVTRSQIKDEQFSWLENMQPIADGCWRALASNGAQVTTTSAPRTIVYHYEFNVGKTEYAAIFLDDGTAYAVELDNLALTSISATPGAFYNGGDLPQCAQFGQSGILIVSTATLGYSFFNGTTLFTGGGLGPTITVTNGGSAYVSAPAVVFSGGSGSGAAASATVSGGSVTGITLTNPGSGYQVGDVVTITLIGGQQTGSGASLTAVLSSIAGGSGAVLNANFSVSVVFPSITVYTLTSISIANGGSGYSSLTTATFHDPAGRGNPSDNTWTGTAGKPAITLTIVGGVITGVTATGQGTSAAQWDTLTSSPQFPTITVVDNAASQFTVTSVTGPPTGTNYSPSTTITASGGGSPVTQATITPSITGGVITGTSILNGGIYGSNTPPTLTVNDVAVTATATAELMPVGTQGTCVETYAGRIWIGNGAVISFNAPGGDVANWNPAQGAGAFTSNDSFLRVQYTALKQADGFLYLFADSSINVISNVQTGGTPVTTTFNNQNVDPEIGTPWHNAVQAMSEGLVFANVIGVFSLTGGFVKKVSDEVDGTFRAATATLNADSPAAYPTSAVMTLNNKLVYLLAMPVQGPFDVAPRIAVLMWDTKRFWIGSQDVAIVSIGTQEINSQIYAWVNTGTQLRPMFTTPTATLAKTWQTKLWSTEALESNQAMRLFTVVDEVITNYTINGTYDYKLENTTLQQQSFTITGGAPDITGVGSIAATIRGNYMGMTLTTMQATMTLVTHRLLYQVQSPLGG